MAREQVFNGKRARQLRRDMEPGLSLAELAEKIGPNPDTGLLWSRDTLSNVELGHKQPGLKLSHAWAAALDVPRSALLMDAPESDTP